ncbi:RHS repeat-associated core domain-containing protein [Paludibaculum fermentans]|uniref:RHS repeat-associated core domain-containing protein n=1 Tax=Paludibaculum fermentans TaxID=1473598 RepID=A0A7S7NPQ6_PALFE|nr:hypothetical protein IRI77_32950 [Paludibaculum fermentans]
MATKTDATGVVTMYGRDGYGRLVGVYVKPVGWTNYDYTQSPTYFYDNGVNAQGRLSTVTLGPVVETYEYSVGGLITKKKVEFQNNDTPLEANYTYDTEGRLASMKYPDVYNLNGTVAEMGRTLTYFYDPMGVSALRDSTYPIAPGSRAGALRNAAAQITQMVVYKPDGTSDTESFTYNGLGQLTQASGRGSNIEYRYSATANDWRITSRKDNVSGEEVSYQYDQLGRLIAASTTGPEWGLEWVYDGFGNRLQQNRTKGTGPSAVFNVDPATNRMTGTGMTYDANGNMTGFGTGSGTATYDLFNRMATVTTGNGTEGYIYSAANQRIQITRPTGTVETFFYGLRGELLGVYQRGTKANGHKYFSSASIRVWFAGRLIGSGANSMVTDRLGSVVKSGTESLSYYPYGEQQPGNANADREKFATYTRDAASGLDYGWNRDYASSWGRFTTADPYRASLRAGNPGSWNRYAYVEDDPVNANDPSGLEVCWVTDSFIGVTSPYPCNGAILAGAMLMPDFLIVETLSQLLVGNYAAEEMELTNCEYQLYVTPLENSAAGVFGSHVYLALTDRAGHKHVIEGGPQRYNILDYGKLRAYVTDAPRLPEDEGRHFGPHFTMPQSFICNDVDRLLGLAKSFRETADYQKDGPNSNSFMHWLLSKAGLSDWYTPPPSGTIGWYDSIPGN